MENPIFIKMYPATFSKSDRLKNAKKIKQLFETGDGFIEFPFRVVWKWTEEKSFSVQIAISVPKKKIPKAVNRNRIKRLFRESYRKRSIEFKKNIVYRNNHLEVIFVFMDTQLLSFNEIDHKITVTLERLEKML